MSLHLRAEAATGPAAAPVAAVASVEGAAAPAAAPARVAAAPAPTLQGIVREAERAAAETRGNCHAVAAAACFAAGVAGSGMIKVQGTLRGGQLPLGLVPGAEEWVRAYAARFGVQLVRMLDDRRAERARPPAGG